MHVDKENKEGGICEACGGKLPEADKPSESDESQKPGHMAIHIQLIMEKPDAELEEGDVEDLMQHASKNHQRKKFGKSKNEFGKDRFTKGEDDAI